MGIDHNEAARQAPKPRHPQSMDEAERMLEDFFPPHVVKWLPQSAKAVRAGGREVLAMPYIDARVVQDRLDRVFGKAGWQVTFRETRSGAVRCRLRVLFPGLDRWTLKEDVGSPSEHLGSAADNVKGGYSDALKRCAVQLGVGRYLYRVGSVWVAWDGKYITAEPELPDHFKPADYRRAGPGLADDAVRAVGELVRRDPKVNPQGYIAAFLATLGYYAEPGEIPLCDVEVRHVRRLTEAVTRDQHELDNRLPDHYPKDGRELHARLARFDARLAKEGLCRVGELLAHVSRAGFGAGFGAEIITWDAAARIKVAVGWATQWEHDRRSEMADARRAGDVLRGGGTPDAPAATHPTPAA